MYFQKLSLRYLLRYYIIKWVDASQEMKLIEDIKNEELRE